MNMEELKLITVIAFGTEDLVRTLNSDQKFRHYQVYRRRISHIDMQKKYDRLQNEYQTLQKEVDELQELNLQEIKGGQCDQDSQKILYDPNMITTWLANFTVCLCLIFSSISITFCCLYFIALTVLFLYLFLMSIWKNRNNRYKQNSTHQTFINILQLFH